MNNYDLTNPITFFSPYGYVDVDKADFLDSQKDITTFVKKAHKMNGKIKVKY